MKRFAPFIAFVLLISVVTHPVWSATEAEPGATTDRSPAAPIAGAITAVTGIAISPLLGTGAYGAYLYFQAPPEERADLPWFAQVSFWLPALVVVGGVALKDAAGAALPPGWKKPLDVLETIENQATGLVAAGAVVPFTMASLSKMIVGSGENVAAASSVVDMGGLGMIHLAAIDWAWFLNIITVPAGIAIYAVVWMGSHAINGLILLSPWGAIDAALKAARTALLGLMVFAAQMDPWIGALISIIVIIFCYFIAGWSFRLTIFSSIFSWDFFTGRKNRYRVNPETNKVFAGIGLGRAPQRTYGKLVKQADGTAKFIYRPWMVLPAREVELTAEELKEYAVGQGAFFSNITDGAREVFVLPPRYRSHEVKLAQAYTFGAGVEPIGLKKAWSWLTGAAVGRSTAPA